MRPRLALVAAALTVSTCSSVAVYAGVWKRQRADGSVEFTNVPPVGKSWRSAGSAGGGTLSVPADLQRAAAAASGAPSAAGRSGGAFWFRERADGVVEYTNLPPVGARWKVLFKTGPGKASAVRGASDRVPPSDLSPERYQRYEAHIRDQQAFYGIPPALIRAVIKTESDFDPRVVSSAGAQGLMQLMPDTARLMGVTDVFDPRQNIMGGARYLQTLAQRFCRTLAKDGDGMPVGEAGRSGFVCSPDEELLVVAGYHAGPGAVEKYRGLPPYETTRAYVSMVLGRFEQYRRKEAELAAAATNAREASGTP